MSFTARIREGVASSSRRTTLLAAAWAFVLFGTLAPMIVAEAVLGDSPFWLTRVQLLALLGFLALTFGVETLRPLRSLALALLAGYGTFNASVAWLGLVGVTELPDGALFTLSTEVVQGVFTVGLLAALVVAGADRADLFLRVGDPSAAAEREWVPGFRRERPWWRAALLWGGLPGGILVAVNATAGAYSDVPTLASALPVVALAAVLNAFTEEFVYRAAPLADLVDAVGKRHALVLLGAFFGLSHYYGSPGGLVGVGMTAFYGWLLAKSIYETRGLAVALSIHVAADLIIFLTYVD
ncbi:CPBP family intramembrane glutamic endopeptidase [Halosimplex marinum]|uniref:CPBP family intramembrane glutamic endopeptidase n=1 Tax=Halosimplex marinum TaxID=3396620 RepID=UPI003F574170